MPADYYNEALVTAMLVASPAAPEPDTGGLAPNQIDTALAPQRPATEETGAPTAAVPLRAHMVSLLDKARSASIQNGDRREYAEASDFAVSAFIDEILLSSPSWPGRSEWMQNPLQLLRHSTATAGEDFFHILDTLLARREQENQPQDEALSVPGAAPATAPPPAAAAPDEGLTATLEVFALCLAQGYTGMNYADIPALKATLENTRRALPDMADPLALDPLAANGKGVHRQHRVRNAMLRFDMLDVVLWVAPFVLTAVLYMFCRSRLDQALRPFLQGLVPL
jgi:type VI protein secretion system component VasF